MTTAKDPTINPENVDTVAKTFVAVLKAWLTKKEFAEVKARNKKNGKAGWCASHDFCDANMAMFDAMKKCGFITYGENDSGPLVDKESEATTPLWNASWDHACKEYLS